MTSTATDEETRKYFKDNKYFGLSDQQVHFFMQKNLPAVDKQGKIILQNEFEVFMAPNGNGGLYEGIQDNLDKIKSLGIEYLHVCGVDNLLNKLADPLMVGYAVQEKKDFVSKYAEKVDAGEKVGVHVLQDGKLTIIEYSELTNEQKVAKLDNGNLKFSQGFLAQFLIRVQTIQDLLSSRDYTQARKDQALIAKRKAEGLSQEQIKKELGEERFERAEKEAKSVGWGKHHLALKKITPIWDTKAGQQIQYNEKDTNGMKFEQFIFDPFYKIDNFGLIEIKREQEFAPIKNKDEEQVDCRETALAIQSKLHRKWLEESGYIFAPNLKEDGKGNIVYVDARLSYFGEQIQKQETIKQITHLPFVLKYNQ